MKYYSIMPEDWDYKHKEKINELQKNGSWTPCDIPEVVSACGSLFPYITTKTGAINYARGVKKQFPFVRFNLFIGKTAGELELVQSF